MIDAQFTHAAASGLRVACVTCSATGYPGGKWQEKCRAGHPHACPECPRVFSTGQGAAAHHRNVHRADRVELYGRRAEGVRAYWQRRREQRGMVTS